MLDTILVAAGCAAFALMLVYILACDRM